MSIRFATILCALLCLLFLLVSYSAVSTKSATYDEPLHVATGWLDLYRGDFRLSPDVPPLWEYWMALPLGKDALQFPENAPANGMDHRAIAAMYQLPGAQGVDLVNRSRWMSVLPAALLAALIALWAGRVAGPVAAVAAMFAFACDPNWLGHAPLAKNDVAFAAVYLAMGYAIWRCGERPTLPALLAVIILPSICLGTKISGLLVAPILIVSLILRAVMREPWVCVKFSKRTLKLPAAIGICMIAALFTWAFLWAEYQFRFTAAPGRELDIATMTRDLRDAEVRSQYRTNDPTPDQLAQWTPSLSVRAILFCENHKLIPQTFAAGYIYTQSQASERLAFLHGDIYPGGRISYFPIAWISKEPLALIAAALIALPLLPRRKWKWKYFAFLFPPGVYLFLAMTGNVNIGLRHIFPVMAFIDVAIGIAMAKLWTTWRGRGRILVITLAAATLAETASAYPNFIAFFNLAAGGSRGGFALLGDSNLDWGQDLPLLADWQKQHPDVTLYLDYFGTCDPAAYHIRYQNVPGGYVYGPPPKSAGPGVAAISATKLQGLFGTDPSHDFAAAFAHQKPDEVLGGTIYLFHYPP